MPLVHRGVPAGRRQLFRRQNGAGGRRVDKGDIGMPVVIIRRIIVVGIEDDNLLHPWGMRVDRMDMQVAKPQRQVALLRRGDICSRRNTT